MRDLVERLLSQLMAKHYMLAEEAADRIKELEADRNRLSVLLVKHCPQEHHDWKEVLRLTKHLEGECL